MVTEGEVGSVTTEGHTWFHLGNEHAGRVTERLSVLKPIMGKLSGGGVPQRIGQALEIACFRALSETDGIRPLGAFRDLNAHTDATMYSKEEPPSTFGKLTIGNESLDFIVLKGDLGFGIEVKNIRPWLYPHANEVKNAIRKSLTLDLIPVIVARRIPYVTYRILSGLGVVMHQTYNQLLPEAEEALAQQVRDKTLLGYHDVRTGNQPDARLLKFFTVTLPALAVQSQDRLRYGRDLLEAFASGTMPYHEFAARVRRREQGVNEDHDWEPEDDEDHQPDEDDRDDYS